jgi:hypothetical protein
VSSITSVAALRCPGLFEGTARKEVAHPTNSWRICPMIVWQKFSVQKSVRSLRFRAPASEIYKLTSSVPTPKTLLPRSQSQTYHCQYSILGSSAHLFSHSTLEHSVLVLNLSRTGTATEQVCKVHPISMIIYGYTLRQHARPTKGTPWKPSKGA